MIVENLSVLVKPAIHSGLTTIFQSEAIRGLGGQRVWKVCTRNLGDPGWSESNICWE